MKVLIAEYTTFHDPHLAPEGRAMVSALKKSFEKSPLRRNEIIRNVTKNIIAVPKSPMIPRHPRQYAEKPIKIQRFFFWKSSSRLAAPIQIKATFTSSDGWKV